jgi:hypothetical protein
MLREISGGIGPLRNCRREAQEASVMECLASIASWCVGGQVFMEEYLVHFLENHQGRTDGQHSLRRIHEFTRAVRSHREAEEIL